MHALVVSLQSGLPIALGPPGSLTFGLVFCSGESAQSADVPIVLY
jgi:hypothetical protein